MRSGLIGMFSQNLLLMGIFFVVPLYLQLVLGLSALETGIKRPPRRHDPVAFTSNIVDLQHHLRPAGGTRAARAPGTALLAAPTCTLPRSSETYAARSLR